MQKSSFGLPRLMTLCAVLLLIVMAVAGSVQAQTGTDGATIHLFTVTSARDEIVIGVSEAEMPALASRNPVAALANLLAGDGVLHAWRYAPSRGEDGTIRQVPLYRLSIFAAGTVRLEPFTSEQEVVAPTE